MKQVLLSTVLFFVGMTIAVGQISTGALKNIIKYPEQTKYLKSKKRSGNRANTDTLKLSHTDFEFATVEQSDGYMEGEFLSFKTNKNLPNDTVASLKFVGVLYDSLNTASGNLTTSWPYSINKPNSTLFLDSVDIICIYDRNVTTAVDTLLIFTFDASKFDRTLPDVFTPDKIISEFLKVDTVILSAGLTKNANLFGGQGSILTRAIKKLLPKGAGFGVSVQFIGDIKNSFRVLSHNTIKAATSDPGEFLAWTNNSFGYLNYSVTSGNLSGTISSWSNLSYAATSAPDCKWFPFQTLWIDVKVLDTTPLSCKIVPNITSAVFSTIFASMTAAEKTKLCNNDQVKLFGCVSGNATQNLTYSWMSIPEITPDIDVPSNAMYTQLATNKVVTLTVTEGTESTTCSATIFSRGLNANLGPVDSFIPCLSTTTVKPKLTGTATGLSYLWGDNSTVASKINVNVGNYKVTVTNSFGCTSSDEMTVKNPGVNNILNFALKSGVTYKVGVPAIFTNTSTTQTNYNFFWDAPGCVQTNEIDGKLLFVNPGIQDVTITADQLGTGCKAIAVTKKVDVKANNAIDNAFEDKNLNVSPSINNGVFNVSIQDVNETMTISVSDILGNVISVKSFSKEAAVNTTFDLSTHANGVYFVKVSTAYESTSRRIVIEK